MNREYVATATSKRLRRFCPDASHATSSGPLHQPDARHATTLPRCRSVPGKYRHNSVPPFRLFSVSSYLHCLVNSSITRRRCRLESALNLRRFGKTTLAGNCCPFHCLRPKVAPRKLPLSPPLPISSPTPSHHPCLTSSRVWPSPLSYLPQPICALVLVLILPPPLLLVPSQPLPS